MRVRHIVRALLLFLPFVAQGAFAADATEAQGEPDYIPFLEYETRIQDLQGEGHSGGSGRQAIAERIIANGEDGTEIEYFIPAEKDEIRGNAMWMFPARVLVSPDGAKRILNGEELQSRLEDWLKLAQWKREVCSRGGRQILAATAAADPEFLREQQRQSALAIAEMSGEKISSEEAAAKAAKIDATGKISVEFEVDPEGLVWKRSDTAEMTVTGLEYGDETRFSSQTVIRMTPGEWEARHATRDSEED